MKVYSASFSTILLRFYLMMAFGITAIVSGYFILGLVCLPLLISCLLGISFQESAVRSVSTQKNKLATS